MINPNPFPIGKRFGLSWFGGDEGDRTPYFLHAMQALSQVSYTPTGFAVVPDSFIIIAMQGKFVNSFFEKKPTFFGFIVFPYYDMIHA